METNLIETIKSKARSLNRHIVLPDAMDERAIAAARKLTDQGIAKVSLIGNETEVQRKSKESGTHLNGIMVIDPENNEDADSAIVSSNHRQ